MKALEKTELAEVNGGTTCPTYDLTANYNGQIEQMQIATPILIDVFKFFFRDIAKWFY